MAIRVDNGKLLYTDTSGAEKEYIGSVGVFTANNVEPSKVKTLLANDIPYMLSHTPLNLSRENDSEDNFISMIGLELGGVMNGTKIGEQTLPMMLSNDTLNRYLDTNEQERQYLKNRVEAIAKEMPSIHYSLSSVADLPENGTYILSVQVMFSVLANPTLTENKGMEEPQRGSYRGIKRQCSFLCFTDRTNRLIRANNSISYIIRNSRLQVLPNSEVQNFQIEGGTYSGLVQDIYISGIQILGKID